MKRFFVLLFLGVAAAGGIWYGFHSAGPRGVASARVTALLPKGTLALLYVPDFKRSRAQWHQSDLYKLWREPAVQDFLRKPLSRTPENERARRRMRDFEALEMKDAFLAVTALVQERPSIVGGFRFKGSAADAEKVIGPWRTRLHESGPEGKRELVTHHKHEIEMWGHDAMTAATVYAGDWFFVSNDVTNLKAVLDRLDKRATDPATTLRADEDFTAVAGRMPTEFAAFGYARLDEFMKKLAARLPDGTPDDTQWSALRQMRGLGATTAFSEGKMRDVVFVAMPKVEGEAELTRSSLALATQETFLYCASLLKMPAALPLPDAASLPATGWASVLGSYLSAGAASGVTRADWTEAFGEEIGLIGDWPTGNRLPALFFALAVKDEAKARRLVETLTAAAPDVNGWTQSERDGVQYFSQPRPNPLLAIAPTIGLGPKLLVAGLDAASVERAMQEGSAAGSRLKEAEEFKRAAGLVPGPTRSFSYVDTALLYQRLDAALRPMLIMAALVPSVAEAVDLGKLPAVEVITKHLSPWITSQSYQGDGYRVESVGPFSIFQAAVGGMAVSGASPAFYRKHLSPPSPAVAPQLSPSKPHAKETPVEDVTQDSAPSTSPPSGSR